MSAYLDCMSFRGCGGHRNFSIVPAAKEIPTLLLLMVLVYILMLLRVIQRFFGLVEDLHRDRLVVNTMLGRIFLN